MFSRPRTLKPSRFKAFVHYYIKFLSQNTDFVTLNKLGKKLPTHH